MQKALKLHPENDTPEVVFDPEEGIFMLKGRSYPENAREFYAPILKWLAEYIEHPNDHTHVEIHLEYFNSGSVKELFTILHKFEQINATDKDAEISWHYKNGDMLIEQKGTEFKEFLEVPVNLIGH